MSHFNGTEQPPRALLHSRSPREERRELPRSFHSPPALLRTACHRFIFNRAPHTMAPGAAHFAALLSCLLLFFHLFHSFLFLYLFSHLLSFSPFSTPFSVAIDRSAFSCFLSSIFHLRCFSRWPFSFLAFALPFRRLWHCFPAVRRFVPSYLLICFQYFRRHFAAVFATFVLLFSCRVFKVPCVIFKLETLEFVRVVRWSFIKNCNR